MKNSIHTDKTGTVVLEHWLLNEGQASGDLENFLWSCRPHNWDAATSLTESDRTALTGFDACELETALDALEASKGYESSRQ